ncbi:hypothetical protein [Streptomyces sp. NPDC048637]
MPDGTTKIWLRSSVAAEDDRHLDAKAGQSREALLRSSVAQ